MRKIVVWFKQRIVWLVLYGVLAAAISWAGNVFFLAYFNDGYSGIPANGITLNSQAFTQGAVFWAVASFVFFGLIGYWRRVGSKRFWRSVIFFPRWVGRQFQADSRREGSFFFLGLAIGLLITAYLNIYLCLLLAVALAAIAPSWISGAVSTAISRTWDGAGRLIGRSAERPLLWHGSVAVTLVGLATACLVVFLIEIKFPRFGFVLLLLVLAVQFARKRPASSAGLWLMFGSGTLLTLGWGGALDALADDGGWIENGGNFEGWINGEGSDRVMEESLPAAPIGGGGGLIGGTVGEAMGEDKPIMMLDEIVGPGDSDAPVVEDMADTRPPGFRDMALGEGESDAPDQDEVEESGPDGAEDDSTPRTS